MVELKIEWAWRPLIGQGERTGELSGEMAQNGGKMRKRKQLKLKGNKKVKMWGEFRRENLE